MVVPSRERDDAGVADERTAQEWSIDCCRRVAELLEERGDRLPVVAGDEGSKGLVGAVLAPCLGKRLQLDVGRRTSCRAEMVGDGMELGHVEREPAFAIEQRQSVVVEPVDLDDFDTGVGGCLGVDERRVDRADGPSFDDLVGEKAPGQNRHRRVVDIAVHLVARAGGYGRDGRTDRFGSQSYGHRRGIRHTGKQRRLDRCRFRNCPVAGLQQRVDQERLEFGSVTAAAGDKHQVSDIDRGDLGQSQGMSVGQQDCGAGVRGG